MPTARGEVGTPVVSVPLAPRRAPVFPRGGPWGWLRDKDDPAVARVLDAEARLLEREVAVADFATAAAAALLVGNRVIAAARARARAATSE